MFEFLFKYPPTVFLKGEYSLLAPWPAWLLGVLVLAAALLLAWTVRRRMARRAPGLAGWRPAALWLLQSLLAGLLLLLLWRPAVSVATLKPQQNIIAVLIDDSRSMALREDGRTRSEQVIAALDSGPLSELRRRFQVRLYRFGRELERIERLDQLTASAPATHIGAALEQIAAESASLPVGAILLASDGADNSGGVDLETLSEVRRRRIPVHTLGVGRERIAPDLEISDVVLPTRTLADSRLSAHVTFRQRGLSGERAQLTVKENGKILATRPITLGPEGEPQTEVVAFNAGAAGAKNLEIGVSPLAGEQNPRNNVLTRLVNVDAARRRILYMEGEPRWELKFIRRAVDEDRNLEIVSILRTTQNKLYRQGIADPKELEAGFPSRPEELFAFHGLILGTVEVSYFTPAQQELIRQFVDRRGGGLLFLGGRTALADGGYGASPLAELVPVALPARKGTFHRERAAVELTAQGRESLICRLEDDAERNVQRWKKLPALADYQETGAPKAGAVVLAEVSVGRQRWPLLAIQNYGRGRTAVFATGGSWRWQMLQDHTDQSHEMFWKQLLRWLATESPGPVRVTTPQPVVADTARVPLRVEARDRSFAPAADAVVVAHVTGPEGAGGELELVPSSAEPGVYTGEWVAPKPGDYAAEVVVRRRGEELGRDTLVFRREDGVAENFRLEQNRELLERIAEQTGGKYYRPGDLDELPGEISFSEAGITTREPRDLWDMPAMFLLLVGLRTAEWFLRRKWGIV
ncbi:MAG: glutamine amidotransferase [Bryobacterales bacterium]|nr:glutamine amidotransferase [Bryobacteraceae bacterium]MDW8353445.1 glutamine amidotransferase [Bryobacterales bacterium]